jgi:hypothetical protein
LGATLLVGCLGPTDPAFFDPAGFTGSYNVNLTGGRAGLPALATCEGLLFRLDSGVVEWQHCAAGGGAAEIQGGVITTYLDTGQRAYTFSRFSNSQLGLVSDFEGPCWDPLGNTATCQRDVGTALWIPGPW